MTSASSEIGSVRDRATGPSGAGIEALGPGLAVGLPDAVGDASAAPNILVLTHRVPFPPDKGDRIRTYHLLRLLSRRANVHLASLCDEPLAADTLETLRQLCTRLEIQRVGPWSRRMQAGMSLALGGTATVGAFHSPCLRSTVRDWAAETRYDAVLASSSGMVPYVLLPELDGVPAVVDLVDVDSQKWLDYAAASRGPASWLYRVEGRRLRRLERSLADWAHAVTLVSEAEARIYRAIQPRGPVHAISNGVDLEYFQPAPEADSLGCVFVGALDYRPNVDGIVWFCREVWPAIRLGQPDARLALVGRQPVAAVRRLGAIPGVTVVGQVPDVRPYLGDAAIALVPLRIARGVQNKVLEALAMGRPVVASPEAVEGLRVTPGSHLLVAESPLAWSDMVLQLFKDADLRRSLGMSGRRYVEEAHRWEQCLKPMESLVRRKLTGSRLSPAGSE